MTQNLVNDLERALDAARAEIESVRAAYEGLINEAVSALRAGPSDDRPLMVLVVAAIAAREKAERELARADIERDRLWCRALVATLPPEDINRVTAHVNLARALDAAREEGKR